MKLQSGHLNVVKFLIKHDADPKIVSTHEELKTAYDMAVSNTHCKVAEYLQHLPPLNSPVERDPDAVSNKNNMESFSEGFEDNKLLKCRSSEISKLKLNKQEEESLLIIITGTFCTVIIILILMVVKLRQKHHSVNLLNNDLAQTSFISQQMNGKSCRKLKVDSGD